MKLDQHFMINEELCERIVSHLKIKKDETVLEIGPGKGALTKYIIKKTDKLVVIELSYKLSSELISKFKNVEVLNESITNFKELDFDKIIGNLPYSVIESLVRPLIISKFNLAVFTVPNNFMKKGMLKLLLPMFFEIETLEEVNKDAFFPKPKIKSKVISIKHKEMNEKEKVIRKIYLQSDKKLENAVRESFCKILKLTKKQSKEKVPKLSFLDKRVYTLNLDEWKEIVKEIEKE
ncbi:hypothetical protein J4413_00870 [Candidatus Woesearchaeota archaeon]|nr:hypothetical protein [Candidatus Woesearchaeota archaeon]